MEVSKCLYMCFGSGHFENTTCLVTRLQPPGCLVDLQNIFSYFSSFVCFSIYYYFFIYFTFTKVYLVFSERLFIANLTRHRVLLHVVKKAVVRCRDLSPTNRGLWTCQQFNAINSASNTHILTDTTTFLKQRWN